MVLLSVLVVMPSDAGTLTVTPIQLFLSEKRPVTTLMLANSNDTPVLVHIRVMHWMQKQGKDYYRPTRNILAVPPIFELPPYKRQIIHFAGPKKINAHYEQAYRIYLRGMIVEKGPQRFNSQSKVVLNASIPIFVYPEAIQRKFVWSAKWQDSQHLQLQLHNIGNVTLFTHQWQLFSANKLFSRKKQAVFSYIQPNQSQYWLIKARQIKLPLEVRADINGQMVRARVQVY